MNEGRFTPIFVTDEDFRKLKSDPGFVPVKNIPSFPFRPIGTAESQVEKEMFEGAETFYLTDTGFTDEYGILNEQGKK